MAYFARYITDSFRDVSPSISTEYKSNCSLWQWLNISFCISAARSVGVLDPQIVWSTQCADTDNGDTVRRSIKAPIRGIWISNMSWNIWYEYTNQWSFLIEYIKLWLKQYKNKRYNSVHWTIELCISKISIQKRRSCVNTIRLNLI